MTVERGSGRRRTKRPREQAEQERSGGGGETSGAAAAPASEATHGRAIDGSPAGAIEAKVRALAVETGVAPEPPAASEPSLAGDPIAADPGGVDAETDRAPSPATHAQAATTEGELSPPIRFEQRLVARDAHARAGTGNQALVQMLSRAEPALEDEPLDRIVAAPGEVPSLHSDASLVAMWTVIVALLVAGVAFGVWAVFVYRPL